MHPLLSIVICTHNRPDDVHENIAALLPQTAGRPVEILVVDSASSPQAAARLMELNLFDGVQVIRLDEPGLSRARNAGCQRCGAEWIAYLDDDAVARFDWVDNALARISACGPGEVIIGGQVLPRWPQIMPEGSVAPNSLGRRSRMLLSILDDFRTYETTPKPLGVGANLMFRRTALEAIGGFPLSLGRVGKSLASGEDHYVMDALAARGGRSWYDGSISVEHKIHADRLTPRWVEERAWHEGKVSWGNLVMPAERIRVTLKCAVSLPVLAMLKRFDNSRSEYLIRFQHNLGLVHSALGALLASR